MAKYIVSPYFGHDGPEQLGKVKVFPLLFFLSDPLGLQLIEHRTTVLY